MTQRLLFTVQIWFIREMNDKSQSDGSGNLCNEYLREQEALKGESMKIITYSSIVMALILMSGSYLYKSEKTSPLDDVERPVRQVAYIDRDLSQNMKEIQKGFFIEPLPELGIQAKSVILINTQNGDILYNKNIDQSLPVASMSKIMTELLVLEAIHENKISWSTAVSISDYVYAISNHPGFASVQLKKEHTYTVRELFDAMVIHSANGATIALAETIAGSEKDFVIMMNDKAKQLGLTQSNFVNTTGLSNSDLGNFYSTGSLEDTNSMSARDVAMLAKHLIEQFPEILDVVEEPKVTLDQETFSNTNWMLPENNQANVSYEGVDGLKTGFTNEAGYCFAGTVIKDDLRLISVVMGASTKVTRFSETKRLYEAVFE
jgi:serine-type D-Ala-D-Ala carboxypeptidase (penicillin-binding protein 5/6)